MRQSRGNSNDNDHVAPPVDFLSKHKHEIAVSHGKFWTSMRRLQATAIHHPIGEGFLCNRCFQDVENRECVAELIHQSIDHPVFGDLTLTIHIIESLQGTDLEYYCYCGECDSHWFLRGWVCYGDK